MNQNVQSLGEHEKHVFAFPGPVHSVQSVSQFSPVDSSSGRKYAASHNWRSPNTFLNIYICCLNSIWKDEKQIEILQKFICISRLVNQ